MIKKVIVTEKINDMILNGQAQELRERLEEGEIKQDENGEFYIVEEIQEESSATSSEEKESTTEATSTENNEESENEQNENVSESKEENNSDEEQEEINKKEFDTTPRKFIKPKRYNKAKAYIENGFIPMLVGPAGCGKTEACVQLAKDFKLNFTCEQGIQDPILDLEGYVDAKNKYHETNFYSAFFKGGLILFDEIDTSNPQVLTKLNTALANGFFNFGNGLKHKNKNFKMICAGNTFGNGANIEYIGRNVLDGATRNRFVIVKCDYDRKIEKLIAKDDDDLIKFVHDLRKASEATAIKLIVSYRNIKAIKEMENSIDLDELLYDSTFAGLSKNEVESLIEYMQESPENKYYVALKEMLKNAY